MPNGIFDSFYNVCKEVHFVERGLQISVYNKKELGAE
jgi:hypothetical protein